MRAIKPGKEQEPRPPSPSKWSWIALAAIVVMIIMSQWWLGSWTAPKETSWIEFKEDLYANDLVDHLKVINKQKVEIYIKDEAMEHEPYRSLNQFGPQYVFQIGSVDHFTQQLEAARLEFGYEDELEIIYATQNNWWGSILSWTFPLLLILGFFWLLSRRTRMPGPGNPFDFGKSQAKLFDASMEKKPSFADVAGLESAKVEVKEIVEFLKTPEIYTALGAKIPKGVILVGPPGTGKTLLARAVAGEANVPFFSMSGSEFVEMFVGVGASRVRDLFQKAKEKAPSIIFIDEIDAVGRSRGSAFSLQSNDERESTLNQLLTEMDGFGANSGVIVIAATNRPDILDKALLRPGRFDRHIYLELPTVEERKAIFRVHMRPLKLAGDVDIDILAAQTPGFSGADIANICNEAALIAARKTEQAVNQTDFYDAIDRIIGGLERKGKILSDKEKEIIAFHEAGHATVSWFLEDAEELLKVTIVPRGKSLGAAWYTPEEHAIMTKGQLLAGIIVALGGRAAEDITFGEVSSGALDDLEKATKQAYTIITYYGISDKLPNLSYYDSTGKYEQSLQKPYSEATARIIDQEVHKLIENAYQQARQILINHHEKMDELAQELLQKELVLKDDLERIFGKRSKRKETMRLSPQPDKIA